MRLALPFRIVGASATNAYDFDAPISTTAPASLVLAYGPTT